MTERGKPVLFYLPGAKELAIRTHEILGLSWRLDEMKVRQFADQEKATAIAKGREHSVRGCDAYVMQCLSFKRDADPQNCFMELLQALDNLTRCGARYRTAIIPWYFYAAQDKTRRRECLTSSLAARLIMEAGATNVVCVDPHNDAIEGAFDPSRCCFNGLYTSDILINYLDQKYQLLRESEKFAISAVDAGGSARVIHITKHHPGLMPVLPTKIRDYENDNKVKETIIREEINEKIVVIFDDMVRTGGSVVETVTALKEKGAAKVIFAITHPDFCGRCIELLGKLHSEGLLDEVIVTDSICLSDEQKALPFITQVSLNMLLAETANMINRNESVSHLYLDE